MNLFLTVPKWMICFIILTELMCFLLSFVWLKFSSFGWGVDMMRIRSGKTLSLGMPKAPQGNIQGRLKRLSLGMPRKASPLSSTIYRWLTWSYIFYSSHDMCFTWSVLCNSLFAFICFLVCHNHLCWTHLFERDTHYLWFVRMLYVLHLYLLS
jgi:hypothetical protein